MDIEEEKKEFLKLLDERHKEQVYQSFLERHTRFIPREFVQNHGLRFTPVRTDTDPPGIEIGLIFDDVEAAFKRAVEAGATAWYEPALQAWGQTVSYVRDLNGFLVELATPPPGPA